ncbi:MAG TPA: hypothetical protein V6C81_10710 [Planktothrix sp.]
MTRLRNGAALLSLATAIVVTAPAYSQGATASDEFAAGSSAGSSPGSPGLDDSDDKPFLDAVRKASPGGKRGPDYIDSLIQLGMHYNRQNKFAAAAKALSQALAVIDSGGIKPSPADRAPDSITVEQSGDTASARVNRTPTPYEDTMADLLPALIDAETNCGQLNLAEKNVKRLIDLPAHDQLRAKLNLMSAYRQYSVILLKQHRSNEAVEFQQKADDINHSFKGL